MKINKVVVAYSGGLDTSVIIQWNKETYNCEVIAFCADLGQGEDLKGVRSKALKTGASKPYVVDLKEEFVKDYVFPMLRANAVYEGAYLMGTSIARPLIAKKQIEIAQKEKADAVAHGATGKGNDQVRFELTYYALKPDIKVVAPWREWKFDSRESLINYAKKHGIPVPVTKKKPYSSDRNLFHISYEGAYDDGPAEERVLTLAAADAEALLVDLLNELIYLAEAARWAPRSARAEQWDAGNLTMRLTGVRLRCAPSRIKGATHHALHLTTTEAGAVAEVILDV